MDTALRVELLLAFRYVPSGWEEWSQATLNEDFVNVKVRGDPALPRRLRARLSRWRSRCHRDAARELITQCRERGVRTIAPCDPEWPAGLRRAPSPPWILFAEGRALPGAAAPPGVAIVGTRAPTGYGLEVTERFARALARRGVPIWSGMARGVDQAAHRGCLAEAGHTIAILGSGLWHPYPAGCDDLFAEVRTRGTLLSEFPPRQRAQRWTFPLRNRVLAGCVDHVLVTQAAAVSGSLITVRHALDRGATIYAIPDRIDQPMARGTLGLLREGAVPLVHPDELLRELGVCLETRAAGRPADPVLDLLRDGERSLDDLTTLCALPIGEILRRLARAEAEGDVVRTATGRYRAS